MIEPDSVVCPCGCDDKVRNKAKFSVFACRISRKLAPHARITRNSIGLALHLAPGIEMDWSRGISPVARHSAKWARLGGE